MSWLEGDMTNMPIFKDHEFDVVLDKGALDALMSMNTADVIEKAVMMFSEVSRVLKNGGKYVCISLCENYIFQELLSFFSRDFGRLVLRIVFIMIMLTQYVCIYAVD
jgi:ubiquinone/menaquinone biosynthesis C-methylase UbiE